MTTKGFTLTSNPPSISALLEVMIRSGMDPDQMPWCPETIDLATALLLTEVDWQNTTVLEYESQEGEAFWAERCEVCGVD